MKIGVFVPHFYSSAVCKMLWERTYNALTDTTNNYKCCPLNIDDRTIPGKYDPNSLVGNPEAINHADCIVMALMSDDRHTDAKIHLLSELPMLRAMVGSKKIIINYCFNKKRDLDNRKKYPIFNALAAGADLVYADPAYMDLLFYKASSYDSTKTDRNRRLKNLLNKLLDNTFRAPLISPELMLLPPEPQETLQFGDITINHKDNYIPLQSLEGSAYFSALETRILYIFARYKTTYLPRDFLMEELYKEEIATGKSLPQVDILHSVIFGLNKKLEELRLGVINTTVHIGRHIREEDFQIPELDDKLCEREFEYPFEFDENTGLVRHKKTDAFFALTPRGTAQGASQKELLTDLFTHAGQLRSARSDDRFQLSQLCRKFDALFPGQKMGALLIDRHHGRGYRMATPQELALKMEGFSLKARKLAPTGV